MIVQKRGDYDKALEWYQKSLEISEELGNRSGMAQSLGQMAVLALEQGHTEAAIPLTLNALSLHQFLKSPNTSLVLRLLSEERDVVGEARFEEVLKEHLDEANVQGVLELLERHGQQG